jgi:hypothetical protein
MTDIMVGYLIEYGRPKLFAFHEYAKEFASATLQLYNAWTIRDLLACPFSFSTYPKNIYNQLFANYIHLILMLEVDIYAFNQ